jgi:cysteine-rich repeat protein
MITSALFLFSCGQNNIEPPVCGNLIVEAGEQCDDGNNVDADGCEADCSLPRCQNGIVDPGESCFSESQLLLSETPVAITSADLNNDGNQDVITANATTQEIGVFLGQGNNSLAKAQRFPLSQIPTAITAADANADGLVDLFVTFDDTEANANFALLTNTFDGAILGFDESALPAVGKFPKEITAADINVDGIQELIILSQVDPSISIRDLAGQAILTIPLDAAPQKLLLADLNIDTFPELLVTSENILSVFSNAAGTISAASVDLPTQGVAGSLSGADADADGDIDLVSVALTDSSAVELFLNTDGALAPLSGQGPIPVGLTPSAVQLFDLDADTDPDLVATNLSSNDVTILFNDAGVFGNAQRLALGLEPVALLPVDLNNNQVLEFLVLSQASDEISVLIQQNNTLQELARVATLGAPTVFLPTGANSALIAHPASSDITVLANNSLTRLATPIPADSIALGDFDLDGQVDFAIASAALGQVSIFLQATAAFTAPIQVGSGPSDLVVIDINEDGFLDMITSNALSNNLTLLAGDAALNFVRNDFEIQGLVLPTAMTSGDMDDDQDEDLVVVNGINGDVFVLIRNEVTGVIAAAGKKKVGTSATAVGLADLSDDGKLDIVVTSPDNNDAQVVINAGFAAGIVQFKEPVAFGVGLAPSSVSFGDFELDGQQDVLVTNADSNDLVLLRNNGLNGQGQQEFAAEFFVLDEVPFGALILDQNGDDFSDLLVGLQSARSLRLLLSAP